MPNRPNRTSHQIPLREVAAARLGKLPEEVSKGQLQGLGRVLARVEIRTHRRGGVTYVDLPPLIRSAKSLAREIAVRQLRLAASKLKPGEHEATVTTATDRQLSLSLEASGVKAEELAQVKLPRAVGPESGRVFSWQEAERTIERQAAHIEKLETDLAAAQELLAECGTTIASLREQLGSANHKLRSAVAEKAMIQYGETH